MHRGFFFVASLTAAVALCSTPLLAAWGPDGFSICGDCQGLELGPHADLGMPARDAEGGFYVAWRDERNYVVSRDDVYLQRITGNGEVVAGWPRGGVPVCAAPSYQNVSGVSVDGQGGVLISWQDFREALTGTSSDVYAQRILADGTVAPGWPVDGAPVTRAAGYQAQTWPGLIAPDGSGGAFVAWYDRRMSDYREQTFAQHLMSSSVVSEGWDVNGNLVSSSYSLPTGLIPDGRGGMLIAWDDYRRFEAAGQGWDTYALHLLATGERAPDWPEGGLLVTPDRVIARVFPDGADGFFVGCVSTGLSGDPHRLPGTVITAQRSTLSGQRSLGWPADGVDVCSAAGDRFGPEVAPDGQGGMVMAWYDYRSPLGGSDIYLTRVLPDGSIASGFPIDGLMISDPTDGREFAVAIAGDGQGGAYVAWERQDFFYGSRIQHITGAGQVASGWPSQGFTLSSIPGQFGPQLLSDGEGGVFAVWTQAVSERGEFVGTAIYAQRFLPDGPAYGCAPGPQSPSVELRIEPRIVTPSVRGRWLTARIRFAAPFSASDVDVPSIKLEGIAVDPDAPVEAQGSVLSVKFDRARLVRTLGVGSVAVRLSGRVRGECFAAYDTIEVVGAVLRAAAETQAGGGLAPPEEPTQARLLAPSPTPGTFDVRYYLPQDGEVRLGLFDINGRRVASLVPGPLARGWHAARVEPPLDAGSGVFFLRLEHAAGSISRRVLIVH